MIEQKKIDNTYFQVIFHFLCKKIQIFFFLSCYMKNVILFYKCNFQVIFDKNSFNQWKLIIYYTQFIYFFQTPSSIGLVIRLYSIFRK